MSKLAIQGIVVGTQCGKRPRHFYGRVRASDRVQRTEARERVIELRVVQRPTGPERQGDIAQVVDGRHFSQQTGAEFVGGGLANRLGRVGMVCQAEESDSRVAPAQTLLDETVLTLAGREDGTSLRPAST